MTKPVAWMVGASVTAWLAIVAIAGAGAGAAALAGMAGPLAVASGTWPLMERTWRRHPERLTPFMLAAFGGKMLFFGAYVAVMLRVLAIRPVPFVVSFTAYFVALHAFEAFALRRLFAS